MSITVKYSTLAESKEDAQMILGIVWWGHRIPQKQEQKHRNYFHDWSSMANRLIFLVDMMWHLNDLNLKLVCQLANHILIQAFNSRFHNFDKCWLLKHFADQFSAWLVCKIPARTYWSPGIWWIVCYLQKTWMWPQNYLNANI